MYNVSQTYKNAVRESSRDFTSTYVDVNGSRTNLNDIIEFSIDKIIGDSDKLKFGYANAAVFHAKMNITERTPSVWAGEVKPVAAMTYDGITTDLNLGTFYIDTTTVKISNKNVEFYAYDLMYTLGSVEYDGEECTNTRDIILVLSNNGVPINDISTYPSISWKKKLNGITIREIIQEIALLSGSNAIFDENGKLSFINITTTDFSINGNNYSEFEKGDTKTSKISKLITNITTTVINQDEEGNEVEEDITTTYTVGDDTGTSMEIESDNVTNQEELNAVYSRAGMPIVYQAHETVCQGFPHLIPGDVISISTISSETYDIAIAGHTLHFDGGFKSTLRAAALEQSEEVNKKKLSMSLEKIIEQISTVKQEVTTVTGTAVDALLAAEGANSTADNSLQAAIDAQNKANELIERADSGEFKGDTGATGPKGEQGVCVTSVDVYYYSSTSNTTQTGGTWETDASKVSWASGRYVWTKTITKLDNNTTKETKPICVTGGIGPTGATGSTGNGVSKVEELYAKTTSSTSIPADSAFSAYDVTKHTWTTGAFIWTATKITYTNGTSAIVGKSCDSSWLAVNDIKVGGTNLLDGTKDWSGTWTNITTWAHETETYKGLSVMRKRGQWGGLKKKYKVTEGETYTFSVYVKGDGVAELGIYVQSSDAAVPSPTSKYVGVVSKEWARAWFTFKAAKTGEIEPRIENRVDSCDFWACGYQLELGNVPTDWSASVNDAANDTQLAIDNINIGGRNLSFGISRGGNCTISSDKKSCTLNYDVSHGDTYFQLGTYSDLVYGQEYTVSFNVSGLPSGSTLTMAAMNMSKYVKTIVNGLNAITFVFDSSQTNKRLLLVDDHTKLNIGTKVTVTNIQLEKGNKATDYTKAPEEIENGISDAKDSAAAAQATANGKNMVFYLDGKNNSSGVPTVVPTGTTASPLKMNDLWFNTGEDNCSYRWNGSQWERKAYGSAAIDSLDAGKITTGILDANRIEANSITTAKLATDAIKSINYVANSAGSYLNLKDGTFDSKNLKWDAYGTLKATNVEISGTITGSTIKGSTVYSPYLVGTEELGFVKMTGGEFVMGSEEDTSQFKLSFNNKGQVVWSTPWFTANRATGLEIGSCDIDNLGIGAATVNTKLTVNNNISIGWRHSDNTYYDYIKVNNNNQFVLGSRYTDGTYVYGKNGARILVTSTADGLGQILSEAIYNRTFSGGGTVTISSAGTLGRISSASKYKLAIGELQEDKDYVYRILKLKPKQWFDKYSCETYSKILNGEIDEIEAGCGIDSIYGLIAEDLVEAGLEKFCLYNKDGGLEGIQYERLPILLIPIVAELYRIVTGKEI
ncbi:MAG: hypothetical protein Q4F05_11205 [bacterium]|nr:hypothetical protein [bacterium]